MGLFSWLRPSARQTDTNGPLVQAPSVPNPPPISEPEPGPEPPPDPNHVDRHGTPALGRAASNGNLDEIRSLLAAGARIDDPDAEGRTPLMRAIEWHCEAARLLIESGADLEATDNRGLTPLMHAAQNGSLDTLKMVVESGADLSRTDNAGNTALALVSGPITKTSYLREMGAAANTLVEVDCVCLLPERFAQGQSLDRLHAVLQRSLEIMSDRISPRFGVKATHRRLGAFTNDPVHGVGIVLTWTVTPEVRERIAPATRDEWDELIAEFDRHGLDPVLGSLAGRV